ncbi:MAG: hypothetical protein ABI999_16850 [Acidobacteriota bacterium]
MLVALEGSSPTIRGENNRKYYVWNAYCETVFQDSRKYEPGPAAISMGGSMINIRKMANDACEFIGQYTGDVFLIGWSRGAAACIQTALDLFRKQQGSSEKTIIKAMFLFDAVDQDTSTSDFLNFIPGNVGTVYHAIATHKSWLDRRLFPTCGRTWDPGVKMNARNFNTSHGGIAGADAKLGDAGSKTWMWDNLKNEGVI